MRILLIAFVSCFLLGSGPFVLESEQVGIQSVIMTSPVSGSILNPCLISAWPMNEGSGLTLHDTSTGGTNTATISGAPAVTWQSNAGFPGTTPLWNGTGNAAAASTTLTNFDGTTPFSVSAWIKLSGLGTGEAFVGTLNPSSSFIGWEIGKQPTGGLTTDAPTFLLVNTFPTNRITFIAGSSNAMTTGLNFLVVTYDGSRNVAGVTMYLNGVSIGPAAGGTTNTLSATTANGIPTTFASRIDGSSELTGAMAFVEVYNCVITSGFVSSSFASGPGIY